MASKKQDDSIEIVPPQTGAVQLAVVGESPLILHRLADKARRELLLPPTARKKGSGTLKNNPYDDFENSPVTLKETDAPTLLALPAAAFKKSLATAALDSAGAKKAQIGRLVYVPGDTVPIFGTPCLYMAVVREGSGMNKTPNIRTRVIVPKWAALVEFRYVKPLLNETVLANLLAAAGITCGVGDGRPEKGALAFGRFRVASPDDSEFLEIVAVGRAAQERAMRLADPYDDDTRELLSWFDIETKRRGMTIPRTSNPLSTDPTVTE
jgi:hypothetical protein